MSGVISIADVGKAFGDLRVLGNVSADIGAAEFVSVLGPSGCGKSTLLRLIAGLTPFEHGSISFNGTEVTAPAPEMGFVFQTSNLLPWLNVRDNLLLGVDLDAAVQRPSDAVFADLVETLGLTGFEASYPHQLSGGMRHRVAIGQALARNPQVLLMDEPFGALDALTRDRLNMELLRIWQRDRKTVVLVTHSISEAVLLSDRVLVMSERPGTIIEDVRIDLPRPRDPSVTREDPAFGDYVVRLSKLMGVS
ncbi:MULTISPECIES: ABC transporter ATP-binding protein [unclassified Sphingopyxis]|uniref:ABC transporter ATP-binding protein n=1 Tax=unclassified Sphingopyxis TaxID=2614943 RepID=UPI0028582432|nr:MULTISPECIES: ABC transporter ATP-binding protein [unclassified Sphingopyxis]MDR6834740.1 NitT/TauT family transport system ATP-binding protein [Sphingopyxis sp. BE122]MDR7227011.1 NitT/TauT family transport system ATP-binding protein [Sphingopyxis sp. BE259]